MHWIVIANTNLYRIYSFDRETNELSLLKAVDQPQNREKISELVTDKPGRYKTRTHTRGTYESHSNHKDDDIDHFLKGLAQEFEAGRIANQYQKLILFSAPHVSGLIAKHINKNVSNLLNNDIKKDYTHMPVHELSKFIDENWKTLNA